MTGLPVSGGAGVRLSCPRNLLFLLVTLVTLAAPGAAVAQAPPEYPAGGNGPSSITVGPDNRLWYTLEGTLTAADNRIGAITTGGAVQTPPYPVGAPSPGSIAFNPAPAGDGNLWFTTFESIVTGESHIGRITPAGAVTLFPLPAVSGPSDITAGPDGNLYFTRFTPGTPELPLGCGAPPAVPCTSPATPGVGAIGKVTLSAGGAASVNPDWFPLSPTFPADTEPSDITATGTATNAAIWFTANVSSVTDVFGAVGRVSFTGASPGTASRTQVGTGEVFASGIEAVPSQNAVFVSQAGTRKIARIPITGPGAPTTGPSGTATDLAGTTRFAPHTIVFGPDNALWFSEFNEVGFEGGVGRMTLDGAYTQWIERKNGSAADGIAVGPDNKIWFTEKESSTIVLIDPTKPPFPACSDGIDNDLDGRIDFPADPGCSSAGDTSEADPPPPPPPPPGGGSTSGGSTSGTTTPKKPSTGPSTTQTPQPCTVPKLRGLTVKKAKKRLRRAKCRYRFSGQGIVVKSKPKAGKRTTKTVVVTTTRARVAKRG